MAANVQYSLGVNADTSQAKKAISELQRSIDNLSKMQINTNYLDKGINDAVAAAKELEYHLNAALNQNTGKLNLNAFTQSLADSNISAKDLMQTLLQGGAAGQQTFTSLANAIAQSEVPLRRANKTLQDFATTLKNTVKWEISSTMVHGLESALSGAVSYAKNLNTSLTNIRIVTGQSVDDMARFAKEANVAAKALSTTTKSYADASLIYYQQGDSAEMAAKKAAITIKAANASFETSAKEMSEYLTSVWNSYQVGADELERYVDIMANLGAKTATSLEEIATSMQKVAATANTVGVSMEQVSSIIATVSSVTRESAESIGTSYKTIFARIGDLKLGKVDEDGVGLGQISSQLDAIGIKILDESGNLREMGDIIMDLGTKWQTMNQAQKTAVAQVVAGKRQYTQLMALFENWDMFNANMNIAENSEGALQNMADIYAESWEAASARVQASLESIYGQILNDEAIIKLTNGFASVIDGVDTLIERLGGMKGTLATLGSIGINVFSKQIAGGINKTIGTVTTFASQFNGIKDIFGKIKSNNIDNVEQIEYKKSLADWDSAIAEVKTKTGEDSSEAIALQNSRDLLSVKQQLINAEHSLSDAQKARAQALISQQVAEQEHLLQIAQQKEQLAKNEKTDDTKYLQRLINERTKDGKTSSSQARALFENAYKDGIQKYRQQANEHAAFSSTQTALENIRGKDPKVITEEIERLKKILGKDLASKVFDDFNGDIDTTIKKLEDLQAKATKEMDDIADGMKTRMSGSEKAIVDEALETAFSDADTKVNLKFETAGAESTLSNIKKKISELFGSDSKVMNSIGDGLAKAAGTLTSMVGGFEAGASLVSVWNDETAGLGDHLTAAAGAVTNLASGFAAGGPWGLALTAITMVISGIIQAAEEAKKVQAEDFERLVEKGNEKDTEVSNIKTLVQNYNTLKETYETTGTGQDALAESARKLAEAYGVVGANVAIASGNFKEFERMIAQSSGLDKTERFYKDSADELRKELAVNKRNNRSMYWDDTILDDNLSLTQMYRFSDVGGYTFADHIDSTAWNASRNKNTALVSSSFASDVRVEDAERQLMLLKYLDEQKNTTEGKISEYDSDLIKLANIQPNIGGFVDTNPLQTYYDSIQVDERSTNIIGWKTGTNAEETSTLTRDEFMSQIDEGFNATIQNYLGEVFYDKNGQAVYDFSQITDTAGQIIGDPITKMIEAYMKDFENEDGTYTINQANLAKFYETSAALKQDWVNSIIKWVTDQKNLLSESLTTDYSESIALAEDELLQAQKDREEAMRDATYEQLKESLADQYSASGLTEIDYFDPLTDDQGYLTFAAAEDKEAWYALMLEQQKAAQAEKDKVDAEIAKEEERLKEEGLKDSEWLQVLKYRQEMLGSMLTSFESLNDEDLTKLIQQVQDYDKSAHEISLITKTLSTMLGKSEANTKFSEFVDDYLPTVQTAIDEAASQYEELQPYLKKGKDGEYINEVDPNFEDKYNAARDALALKFISDWTSFDDFIYIYQDLAANFKDGQFDKVKDYISAKGTEIKDSSVINNALISAMKKDLSQPGGEIGANTARVRALNEQVVAGNKSVETYKNMQAQASAYKDNLSYEDALALQETLFQEGTDEWAKFVATDGDARKAYLEARAEQSRKNAAEAQRLIADNAKTEQQQFFREEEDYEKAKSRVQNFFGTYMLDEKTGQYVNRTDPNDVIDADRGKAYEALNERVVNYEYWQGVAKEAEDAARAFELLDSNGERAVTKIERMRSAISKLPSDMEEFNKLVKQLGNIDPKKLINMSDLDRAELILKELEKPTETQFNVWDGETQKYVFNAAGYNEAMEAYEASRLEAVDVILASADAAFTQIENRMNHAKEEAEKIKTIAETLSGAIETGELTETQKLGMSPELIQQWEQAADAPARAAIAMQQWNKYAVENATAARELLTIYNKADNVIFTPKDLMKSGALNDSDNGRDNFRDMLAQMSLDKEVKDVWMQAWDNAVSQGIDFSGKTDMQIIKILRDEIGEMGELTKEEMDAVTAAVKDNMTQMFQELHDQNIEQARSAADAWLDAFNTINDAKLKLLSGESILEMIAGDPQAILTMAQNTGKTISEIINGAISGSLKASDFKDFDMDEYVDTQMAAAGMFDGFGEGILKDMNAQGYQYDREKQVYYNPENNAIVSERDVLGPIYETMLKAINPTATQNQIQSWLNLIFADPAKYTSLLVEPMNQLTDATVGAGEALNIMSDQQLIEAASDVTQQEADFRGQKVEYEDLTEVQAAIDRAQQAKYAGESWESLSQEDRDLLGQYGIDFNNVDTAANECASALAACAQAALDLMKATAEQEGYTYSEQEKAWGKEITADVYSDGTTTYTDEEGRSAYGTDWDTYKAGLTKGTSTRWVASEEVTEQMEKGQEAVDAANDAVKDTDYQTVERMASSVGMATDEFDRYAETLYKVNGGTKDFNELSATEKQELRDTARLSQMAAEGWKEIKESQEDNIKTIKKGDKTTTEYYESLSDLTKSVKKAFGGCEAATEDFVEAHMDDIEKMAEGDIEAAERIESALLMKELGEDNFNKQIDFDVNDDEVKNELDTMGSLLSTFGDQWRDKPIGFEATLDNTPALAGLQQLLDSGYMTVDQMNAALATIGWAPEIEYEVIQASDQQEALTVGSLVAGSEVINVDGKIVTKATGQIAIPKIKSARKTGGGSSGASRSSSGGNGGGGGSKTPEKKDKIRGRDEIERYHKQNDTIDRLASSIEKIDKLKERAYGKDHLAQIDAETEALNKQLAAQQDLHNEALKWMAADKADLAKYGAEYDENGTIVNYERVMERIIDEYNSAIETYNNSSQGDGDKLALEAAQQRFEDAKKAIENYEEALTIANDSANEMLEIQNQMSELEVEKITYELELKIDMNERDLELLEYYQDKYEDQLSKQDELFNTFLGSMAEYESNLANLGTAYEQLNVKFAAGLINETDYAEAVADLQSQIVDNLSSLNEIQTELVDTYANTLSLAREEVEKTTDAIDHSNEAMQSFMDIMALSGLETDYKRIGEFYKIMNDNNLTKLEVQRAHLDALLAEEQRFKDKVGEMTDLEKQQYAALQEEIQDTRDTLLSSTQEALETIRSTYENTINDIAKNLDNFMAGAAGSMSYLQEQYGYFQEQQDRYVSTAKELYEVSKLSRDIEGTLATATTDASKEALKALQEKINKQSELNELTEYDIEMNQLQYQLLLARIQLEEAQNAKDVVRLTRDENGNYAYRYTANQDKIDEAAQHYEDVLQQINDTTVQRTSEIEQQLLNTMATYKEKFQEVANDYTLTESERLMKLQDLNSQFAETMRYLQEQNNIVTENLTANQEAIAEHYGVSMSEITASTAGNINDTVQSMMDKTEEYINAMNAAIFGENGAQTAWYEYMSQIGDIEGVAGTAYENMLEDAQDMGQMNEFAAEEALEVIQTLEDTLQPLADLSAAWDAHNAILEATIADYEQLAENINAALAVASEFANTVGVGSADGSELNMAALGMISTNEVDLEDVYESYQDIIEETRKDATLTDEVKGQILESYNEALASIISAFGVIEAGSLATPNYNEVLEQSVQIAAEFPNVTNHTEVEEALMNLINQAAQFAQRKN